MYSMCVQTYSENWDESRNLCIVILCWSRTCRNAPLQSILQIYQSACQTYTYSRPCLSEAGLRQAGGSDLTLKSPQTHANHLIREYFSTPIWMVLKLNLKIRLTIYFLFNELLWFQPRSNALIVHLTFQRHDLTPTFKTLPWQDHRNPPLWSTHTKKVKPSDRVLDLGNNISRLTGNLSTCGNVAVCMWAAAQQEVAIFLIAHLAQTRHWVD